MRRAEFMPDKDVLLSKIFSIQRCLNRIREVTGLDPTRLDDVNVQDIFVLNLQRAVQFVIDIAVHIVASEGFGVADIIKENFALLEREGIIDGELSKKMQAMVGFRNIAIHEYQELSIDVLKHILKYSLGDIEDFYVKIAEYYRLF